jgi:glyoxylase-like metal-dependent hydrolase (beta-lactamase superfamily II)
MKLHTIESGYFKLDGGAMFGVVPKTLWKRINPPDENNMCTWAMRCLLVETGDRKILIDTGMGDKQDEKFRSFFHPHGKSTIESSLSDIGLGLQDITDVFITHMHFDHVGGAVKRDAEGNLVPTFPNAIYWSNEKHYKWALDPNERERASFLKENIVPLMEHGVLKFLPSDKRFTWFNNFDVLTCDGHTEAMMVPIINTGNYTLVYCADLLPSSGHLGRPYVMSYDIRPLVTLVEKDELLEEALANDWYLFLEHDPVTEVIRVARNERGKVVPEDELSIEELKAKYS